jgi:hypothetical protein
MKDYTGGYKIIPITDVNGGDVLITTTAQSIKSGTFKKIVEAYNKKKPVLMPNILLASYTLPIQIFLNGIINAQTSGTYEGKDAIRFTVNGISSSGAAVTYNIIILSDDTILRV